MMIFSDRLYALVNEATRALYGFAVPRGSFVLQATVREYAGTHTLVLFPLLRFAKRSVTALGKTLGDFFVKESTWIASYEIVGGFLNLILTDAAWCMALEERVGEMPLVSDKRRIIVEIACPNTNKPLHLGHLRNTFIGDAVANILAAVGHDVKKINHVNDRGVHICKSMYAYQQDEHASTPLSTGQKGDHFVGAYYVRFDKQYKEEVKALTKRLGDEAVAKKQAPSLLGVQSMLRAWEAGDKNVRALWEQMNAWVYEGFAETYGHLNIHFDKSYYESEVYLRSKKVVEEGLQEGIFYQKEDGAVWVDLTAEGLGHKLLLRGDGTSVYITQDLGTADLRYEDFEADRSIYVVGDEQTHHFAVLFAILKKLRRSYADQLYHLAYGMIDLPDGKMKSREGTVVDADGVIDDMIQIAAEQSASLGKTSGWSIEERHKLHHVLAIGALKFFLLKISPQKRMCFDPRQSIDFLGYTAGFIQYCYARIVTLLDRATLLDIRIASCTPKTLHSLERKLIVDLVHAHDVLYESADTLNPALCAKYLYDLAKTYNQFYAQLPILRAPELMMSQHRCYLSLCVKNTLSAFASLLNIELPQRM